MDIQPPNGRASISSLVEGGIGWDGWFIKQAGRLICPLSPFPITEHVCQTLCINDPSLSLGFALFIPLSPSLNFAKYVSLLDSEPKKNDITCSIKSGMKRFFQATFLRGKCQWHLISYISRHLQIHRLLSSFELTSSEEIKNRLSPSRCPSRRPFLIIIIEHFV